MQVSRTPEEDIESVVERIEEVEARLREAQSEIERLRSRLAKAEEAATTDSLTGIPNRRGFLDLLADLAREADLGRRPLSLLMVDVDHFKEFNDRFGHDVGDHVLRLVAHALTEMAGPDPRLPSLAGRYGGEEFAVALQATGDQAMGPAERLREDLARRHFIMRGTGRPLGRITISIGVAERRLGEEPVHALRRADTALLTAKQSGRNRVERAAVRDRAPA